MSRIAVSLPDDLFQAIESVRKASGETRSQFLRRAVAAYLRRQQEGEAVAQYLRSYQQLPETVEEVAESHALGSAALSQEPWP